MSIRKVSRQLAFALIGIRDPGGTKQEFDLTEVARVAGNRAFKAKALVGIDVVTLKKGAELACIPLGHMRRAVELGFVQTAKRDGFTYVPAEYCAQLGTQVSERTAFGRDFLLEIAKPASEAPTGEAALPAGKARSHDLTHPSTAGSSPNPAPGPNGEDRRIGGPPPRGGAPLRTKLGRPDPRDSHITNA